MKRIGLITIDMVLLLLLLVSCGSEVDDNINIIETNVIAESETKIQEVLITTTELPMTIELTEEIKAKYDKSTVSYRLAELIATDLNQCSGEFGGWLSLFKHDIEDNKEPFESMAIVLVDMDGDGCDEAIISMNLSFAFDKYYYIYSLKNNKVLFKNYYYWDGYSLYKKDGKILFSCGSAFPGYTSQEYYELTNQEFDYEGKLSLLSTPIYSASCMKEYYFLYKQHDIENPYKRFDGKREYTYPGNFDADEAFRNDLEEFENSMTLCTDEYMPFTVMNTDFESFSKLIDAIKPLDNM